MINTDRIVPVTVIDLISLYGLILLTSGDAPANLSALSADTTDGQFSIDEATDPYLANEPLKSLDFPNSGSQKVYFVAAYDYVGFTINGTPVITTGVTVNPDGRTLYLATLSGGNAVAITQIGF